MVNIDKHALLFNEEVQLAHWYVVFFSQKTDAEAQVFFTIGDSPCLTTFPGQRGKL